MVATGPYPETVDDHLSQAERLLPQEAAPMIRPWQCEGKLWADGVRCPRGFRSARRVTLMFQSRLCPQPVTTPFNVWREKVPSIPGGAWLRVGIPDMPMRNPPPCRVTNQ